MIRITRTIHLDEGELEFRFARASGPGGQHVNKVESMVQLRFDVANSPSLPDEVRARLMTIARRRLTREGILVIRAQRYRMQERNRQDALNRLIELIQRAAKRPRPRKPTRPTAASRRERIDEKRRRSAVKRLRRPPGPSE